MEKRPLNQRESEIDTRTLARVRRLVIFAALTFRRACLRSLASILVHRVTLVSCVTLALKLA